MKHLLKYFAFVMLATIAMVACTNEPKREPITSDFALYLDGYQLVEKSGILEQITESNRLMMASAASSQVSVENSEFLKGVIANLDNSGLSLTKPIYALINYNENSEKANLMAVVEVHDADSVDRLIATLSELNQQQDGVPFVLTRSDDNRFVDIAQEGVLVGYNENRMVLCVASDNLKQFVDNALVAPLADLTPFGTRDFALYCNNHRILDILEKQYSNQLSELTYRDETIARQLESVVSCRTALDEHSSSIIGLTFENGKIVLDSKCNSVNSEQHDWIKMASGSNLDFLPEDTLAFLNMTLDGEKLMAFVNNNLTDDIIAPLGVDSNEFNAAMAIATDAISSINGDFSIALNELSGVTYYGYPQVSSVEAIALTDVKDSYIIDNIALFGGAFFTRTADGNYTLPLSRDVRINLGQADYKFFAGVNTSIKKYERSASKARWADVVKGAYGLCLLADIEELLTANIIKDLFNLSIEGMDYPADTIVEQIAECSDYLYLRGTSAVTGEVVWVFDNKNTNALRQISDIVFPYAKLYFASLIE